MQWNFSGHINVAGKRADSDISEEKVMLSYSIFKVHRQKHKELNDSP